MTTKRNIIWQTDEQLEDEYDIANNVELRHDDTGLIEIRVTRETEREDSISLSKLLTPIEAIRLGVALVNAARVEIELED